MAVVISCDRPVAFVVARLNEHSQPLPYEHLEFAAAGYIIGPPYHPYGAPVFEWEGGFHMPLGGSAETNGHAAVESWPIILRFLKETLGEAAQSSA